MSIRIIPDAELEALHEALGNESKVGHAFLALAWANRAAYGLTYGEVVTEPPLIRRPEVRPLHDPEKERELAWAAEHGGSFRWAENVLYNAVSNGGVDFASWDARSVLLDAAARAMLHTCSPQPHRKD